MVTSDNIRIFRKKKNLTQKELGLLCGIAESTIRRYELGKLNPKYETMQKIAAALEVDVQELYKQPEVYVTLDNNVFTGDDKDIDQYRLMEAFRELIILLEYHNIHFIKEKHAFCIVNTNETYILAPDQIPILIDRTIEQCKNLIKSLGQKKLDGQ